MSFEALGTSLRSAAPEGPLDSLPYAVTLGLRYRTGEGGVTILMPFRKTLVGAPQPPRLHGGTVAGLMEIAAIAQLVWKLRDEAAPPGVKPINVTVDYLRAGQPADTFACAEIVRMGRRIANLRVKAWQTQDRPIAAAHMNVMLVRGQA